MRPLEGRFDMWAQTYRTLNLNAHECATALTCDGQALCVKYANRRFGRFANYAVSAS